MSHDHVMVDLETMGVGDRAAIVSIGACWFRPDDPVDPIRDTFHARIDMSSSFRNGYVDGSTVEWWLRQSDAARAALLAEPRSDLHHALGRFRDFYKRGSAIWGNGAGFDVTILGAAYRAIRTDPPWDFKDIRDCRTIADLASPFMSVPRHGAGSVHHSALDDAIHQARWVSQMWRLLRGGPPAPEIAALPPPAAPSPVLATAA